MRVEQLAFAGKFENQENQKCAKHCKTKGFCTPLSKRTRNLTILKLEAHETREPGTRETRALPGPQGFTNAQNRKIGEVAKVENPSF